MFNKAQDEKKKILYEDLNKIKSLPIHGMTIGKIWWNLKKIKNIEGEFDAFDEQDLDDSMLEELY